MKPRRPSIAGLTLWGYALVPWLVFLVVQASVTFGFSDRPKSVGCFIVIVLFIGVGLFLNASHNVHFAPISGAGLLATVAATLMGLYNYDTNELLAGYYDHAQEYTNVVPSEPALSFADAGLLDFTNESEVDITKSVGFSHRGMVYCIAPIFDKTENEVVQFWATGLNCCSAMSDFYCDDSTNKDAHSGAVVFDNNGWFEESNRDMYVKAQDKAMAEFNLISAKAPIYLRWTTSGRKHFLRNHYHSNALIFFFLSLAVYFILSYVLAVALVKIPPPRRTMV